MIKRTGNLILGILADKKKFIAAAVIIYIVVRMATWFYPYDNDEWIFYYVGQKFAQGNVLYMIAWDHKPPLIFLFNGIMSLLTNNYIILRVLYTLVNLAGLYLFARVADVFFKGLLAVKDAAKEALVKKLTIFKRIAILLYIFWTNLAQISNGGNNTENFGIIFLLLMVLTYFLSLIKKKPAYLLVTGFSVSCLLLLKPNFLLFALPVCLDLLFRYKKNWRKLLLSIFLLGIPVLLHVGFWIFYFYHNNALQQFWLASYLFNAKYLQSGWSGRVSTQLIFIGISGIFFVSSAPFILKFLKQRNFFSNEYRRFLFFWLMSVLLFIAILGTFYTFYYLIIIPCLIMVAVPVFETLKWHTFIQKIIPGICILCMILSLLISLKFPLNNIFGDTAAAARENQQIADFIRSNTLPNEKIYAYTYGATFYHLTGRDSGSKFISASHLLLNYRENYGFGFNGQFKNEILTSNTKYIIYPKSKTNLYLQNQELVDFFQFNYPVIVKEFDNYVILGKK